MLNIDSLQNGVVIDHIPAGQGLDIYRLLNLDAQSHSVALLQYVKSEKYGCKDLIKKMCIRDSLYIITKACCITRYI